MKHWHILSFLFFTPCFLLISIALTVTNSFSAFLFDFQVGRINPWTFGAVLTSQCNGHSVSSMPLPYSISDSKSALQLSSVSFGLSKSLFLSSQSSVYEMHSSAPSPWLSTGWQLVLRLRLTCNIWVRPPGRSFAHKAGAKGDRSDNLNAAALSCWKSDMGVFMMSSVSEMYPMAVISFLWARDSVWVARRFRLRSNNSKKSLTFPNPCNFLSSTCLFISE